MTWLAGFCIPSRAACGAMVTVAAGNDDGPGTPALPSAWPTLGDFLGTSLGWAGAAGVSLALAAPGGSEQAAMRLVMQLERDTDGRLCGQITREGAVTSLGFSGTLEMLKVLEDLVCAGDGRGTEP